MTGYLLYIIVLLFLFISGISPVDRFVWWLEVSWVIVGLIILLTLYLRKIELTLFLKWALFLHAMILIYGAWYTYELVPMGEWMKEIYLSNRNNYDRIGHLAQGFFPAILFREILFRNNAVKKGFWMEFFIFALCMAFSAIFEIIEFAAAITFGAASNAYLGSQGDIWDAQWDMVMCAIGALSSIFICRHLHIKQLKTKKR